MMRSVFVWGVSVASLVALGCGSPDAARADESAKSGLDFEIGDNGCQPDIGLPIVSLRPPGMPSPPPLSGSILHESAPAMAPSLLDEDLTDKIEPGWRLNATERTVPTADDTNPRPPRSAAAQAAPLRVAQAEPQARKTETGDSKPPELESPESVDPLDAKISRVLELYRTKYYDANEISPWGIMHAVVAYGTDAKIRTGPSGQLQPAIGWLCFNQRCRGLNLFHARRNGFGLNKGPGYQGHHGQLLAILAQSRLKRDYPIKVNGGDYTIEDLVDYEQRTCLPRTELTFKLIGLAYYLDSDATWTSETGEPWSISRLIAEDIVQPIRGAACGGTHRLFGLNFAVHRRRLEGKPIDGQFLRAQKYIDDYHRYTFSLQNSDGSFSTEWYRGRGASSDADRRIKTTGHILEFMSFSLPDEVVRSPRMEKAANLLADLMLAGQHRKLEIGPQGHAINALRIYQHRVFRRQPAQVTVEPETAATTPDAASPVDVDESLAPGEDEVHTPAAGDSEKDNPEKSDAGAEESLRQVRLPNLPSARSHSTSDPQQRRLRLVP